MARHNVEIAIKARDQASKKLGLIGRTANALGKNLRNLAYGLGVYFGGRAIFGLMKSSIELAAQQEEANALLIQSLKNIGAKYQVVFPRLTRFSAEIQRQTRLGDEEVEQLLQLGLNLGLTTDKIEEATKGAIGLRSIMAGRLGITEAMKYMALAYQGEFTMLRRYIPELRKTTDAQEQLNIVRRKGIEGFRLEAEAARRGLGPMIQLRNTIGDIKEILGSAFLPSVQNDADKLKSWAQDFAITMQSVAFDIRNMDLAWDTAMTAMTLSATQAAEKIWKVLKFLPPIAIGNLAKKVITGKWVGDELPDTKLLQNHLTQLIAQRDRKFHAELRGMGAAGIGGVGVAGAGAPTPPQAIAAAVRGSLSPVTGRLLTFAPGQAAGEDPAVRVARQQLAVQKKSQDLLAQIAQALAPAGMPQPATVMQAANFDY